jgi:hypothetical protein
MVKVNFCGRLGNQMFQYAIARIIAEKNNYNFGITTIEEAKNVGLQQHLSTYFPNLYLGVNDGGIINQYIENHIQKYDENLFNIPDNTILHGYFQTDIYYKGYENKVKDWFKIETDSETEYLLNKFNIDEYCYIHFRGTDYKEFDSGTRFLPKKYYTDAMDKIKEIKPDIKFVIITDDIEESRKYFGDIEIMSNQMMVDFKLLYYSKYSIISNSTFSWWACWLKDREMTIAPYKWLNYTYQTNDWYPFDIKTEKFIYV